MPAYQRTAPYQVEPSDMPFGPSEAEWTFREDDALSDIEKAIAAYTDADELLYDFESGTFHDICDDHNADREQCGEHITAAFDAAYSTLTRKGAA